MNEKLTITRARKICQNFANEYKVIFEDKGECGFGRPCVGITSGTNWIHHNPCSMEGDYLPIPELACDACHPPNTVVDYYHKHDCLAVLYHGDSYRDWAIIQLAMWIQHMKHQGSVHIIQFATGAAGIQALVSGLTSKAVFIGDNPPIHMFNV